MKIMVVNFMADTNRWLFLFHTIALFITLCLLYKDKKNYEIKDAQDTKYPN